MQRQRLIHAIISLLVTVFVTMSAMLNCQPSLAANDRLLFWELQRDGSTQKLYLFGSIHLATADVYPLRPVIMQAFAGADALMVEVNTLAIVPQDMRQWAQDNALLPAGKSLEDTLDADTVMQLKALCKRQGIPYAVIRQFRPAYAATTLTNLTLQNLGYQPDQGLDQFFIRQAGDKPVLELESMTGQLNLMLELEDGALSLTQTLADLDQAGQLMPAINNAYLTGNGPQLYALMRGEPVERQPELEESFQKLFDQRNRAMLVNIEHFAADGKNYFIVVGAGHLLGESGLVALMKQQGYTATRR